MHVIESEVEGIEPDFWQATLFYEGQPIACAAGFGTEEEARAWVMEMAPHALEDLQDAEQ